MRPALQTDRYKVLETLGWGATSRVDKACDTVIGRTVALKSFLQGFGKSSEEQFLREAQTIGRLSHSSIAQLYDVNTDAAGTPFLVMEFVSGNSLEQVVAQSPVPFAKAAIWTADLASALSFAHRAGIIHGDVKPSNIRITEDDKVKLVDFGVARFASQSSGSDRVLGTPAYLSPEQIEGRKQDGRSDLFSLGVVLYEMLTGVRPFTGDSLGDVCAQILTAEPVAPSKRNTRVPAAFDRILARCLAKDPDKRYQSGSDLARALNLVARCEAGLSPQSKRPYWFLRQAHPRDLLAIASAVLLLAGGVITAGSLHEWLHARFPSAVAAIPAKPLGNEAFIRHSVISKTPEPASLHEGARTNSAPKKSQRKGGATASTEQDHVVSTAAPPPDRSPVP